MYCPRCGAPNTETTKFCRQCGLALMEVTNYVATGGTSKLTQPPSQAAQIVSGFSPKQKMILAIMGFIFLPGFFAVLSDVIGAAEILVPICGVIMPIGIVISVMYFRNQAKLLEQSQLASQPPQPYPLPQQTYAPPQPQAYLQMPVMPVSAVPFNEMPRTTPNTNPLAQPISVTEDETKRLPQ
ncbi:MAG: zinc ribbon domain-containing protein [Acidobacteria bacterium]|nr:zinc ribbon domain-containing protein [Acidobacteriota bacterium]